ncbi:MAG: four helix bundle protein [Anaerolineaceae bacterium]|nr:four helix bundle protein [Anaerolineaceae bacterium]
MFAIRIVNLYKFLCDSKKEYVMSKQLLRCGTSIGANVTEAFHSISKKEFVAKLNIALKEAFETGYWLELLKETDFISESQFESINADCTELIKLLTSIIKTTKKNEDYNPQVKLPAKACGENF